MARRVVGKKARRKARRLAMARSVAGKKARRIAGERQGYLNMARTFFVDLGSMLAISSKLIIFRWFVPII